MKTPIGAAKVTRWQLLHTFYGNRKKGGSNKFEF